MQPLVWLAAGLGLIALALLLFAGSRADDLAERHELHPPKRPPDASFYVTSCSIQLLPEQLCGLRAEYERRRKTADPEHAHIVDSWRPAASVCPTP
jgi:hypothetical protein